MHEEWGWLIAIYLFMGGLGAGAFIIAAVFEFSGKRYECITRCPITLTGSTIPGPLLAIGTLMLIFDLGQGLQKPWLIINMFTHFSSVMTWGVWILTFFIPISFAYGFFEVMHGYPEYWEKIKGWSWLQKRKSLHRFVENLDVKRTKRWFAGVGAFLAVSVALYTGILISAVGPAVPFWSTPVLPFLPIPMLPVLFLVSAISTGVAVTVDLADAFTKEDVHHLVVRMPLIHLAIIIVETLLLGLLLIMAFQSGGAAAQSAADIVAGPHSILFWSLIIIPGIIYPFITHALVVAGINGHTNRVSLVAAVGIFISGLFLRYVVVAAGIHAFL